MIDRGFFLENFREIYINKTLVRKMQKDFLYLQQGTMYVIEYESEFLKLSRYATNMFQTEKEIDEICALVAASECNTLAEMIAKARKMETIIRDRSNNFERERIKRGRSSPPPPSSFKKPKDQAFSASRKDS
ncbi:Hexaprenyldihydroxybenzoate methyltransferase, mitochondrial-like protein [Gossypium australe]|uniref:Hexaprenyldihydroxybenzoate methyltransferase, mitochondrial-like protein n=1 Tax=Gossypium australe TaxID=47621 RepID=A0A5B6UX03_9ROSI|nr:Hexaprenyldihydroxybenzoate methyltransferase, mitochondrial-like protein [Gossypium australe]